MDFKAHLREVPDFPKEGINFIDITTLLQNPEAFKKAIDALLERHKDNPPDIIIGIESRGFILGSAMAYALGIGFVPVRKPGKLPAATFSQTYELEYGTDSIEIHQDAIPAGSKVVIVDDLLATGGTASALVDLLKNFDAEIKEIDFWVELTFLNGKEKLSGQNVFSLVQY